MRTPRGLEGGRDLFADMAVVAGAEITKELVPRFRRVKERVGRSSLAIMVRALTVTPDGSRRGDGRR